MYGIYDSGEVIAKFVTPVTVRSNQPVTTSDTLSLRRQATRRTAQRWEISSNVEPLSSGAQDLFVLLVTKGSSEVLQAVMPQNYGAKLARTSISGNVAASAAAGVHETQVLIKDNVGKIPKGTFIRFANHSKVYMLTADVTGEGTMNVYPSLRVAVPQNTGINFKDDVLMNCWFDTDTVQGMVYEDGILMDNGTLTLIEAL